MNKLETYLEVARKKGLNVHEESLVHHDGLIIGDDIFINENLPTTAKKTDVLVEEIAHADLSVGDILDQTDSNNRRQERKARLRAFETLVPLSGIVAASQAHCKSSYEIADFLEVSEGTLLDAIDLYRDIYGTAAVLDNYIVRLEPTLSVYKMIMFK